LGFEEDVDLQAEPLGEVGPGIVVRHDVPAAVGLHPLLPFRKLGVQLGGEPLQVRAKGVGGRGIEPGEPLREVAGDDAGVGRIGQVMRIAGGVDVALGSVERGRDIQHLDTLAAVDAAWRAGSQARVARALEQRTQPAQLQLRAALEQRIGAVEFHQEARLGIHEMRVFQGFGQGGDLHAVSADFTGEGAQVGGRGHEVQRGVTAAGEAGEQDGREQGHQRVCVHDSQGTSRFLRTCGRRVPPA